MAAEPAPLDGLDVVGQLLDALTEPAIVIDRDYRILAANPAYRASYGEELPGRRCHEVSHQSPVPCDQAGEDCPLRMCTESGRVERVLHVHHTPRGDEHVDVETWPIRGADGTPHWFLEILRPAPTPADLEAAGATMVGRSPAWRAVLDLVRRVAPSETPVLLLGASGTGKELLAQAIHRASARSRATFVPVECSGLTETLFESELFGHEKGAFTGAHARRVGLVEAAAGGTLFLDEIGELPLSMQGKLLRVLQERQYERVGGDATREAD
ncbi:MAG TPA: sigma 54-interacting transcriptional regulator, partial [Gammaproteobacteria bacterium]